MGKVVSIECASWFEREDHLIQILSRTANTVVLNEPYSLLWKTIDCEIGYNVLKQQLASMEEDIFENMLNELIKSRLVKVTDKSDNFDLLFK